MKKKVTDSFDYISEQMRIALFFGPTNRKWQKEKKVCTINRDRRRMMV